MADKKWSKIDLLKNIKDKNIELLTVIEDNTSITGYDNKRVKLSDILDPINLDITDIKLQIQNILLEGLNLTTIGVKTEPKPWYYNTTDPENKQLVELSIAKGLYRVAEDHQGRIQELDQFKYKVEEDIENINNSVQQNTTNINNLNKLVVDIKNNYFNKNNIIQTVEDEETGKVPSSNAVFDFVKNAKTEANNYTNTQINEVLKKITNLEFNSFYFDNTAQNGKFCEPYDIESIVINKDLQKIFVVNDDKIYKELSLNRTEVLEIANKVVDWHNSNAKDWFNEDTGEPEFIYKEAHDDYRGKFVGKKNSPDYIFSSEKNETVPVTLRSDCYILIKSDISLATHLIIRPETKVKSLSSLSEWNFIDMVNEKYKLFFNQTLYFPIMRRIIDGYYYLSISLKDVLVSNRTTNFENIDFKDVFNKAYINNMYYLDLLDVTLILDGFRETNTSEVFNDYKQTVPSEIDYFHSVHNLNNGFAQNFLDIPITFTRVLLDNSFVYKCESDVLDLFKFDGYMITIDLSQICDGHKLSLVFYNDYSGTPKTCEELDIHNMYSKLLLKFQDSDDECKMITTFCEFKNNIYPNLIQDTINLIFRNPDNVAHNYIDELIESITIMCDLVTPAAAVYYNGVLDTYSLTKYPCFLAGTNNLSSIGNLFIFGNNNIPTKSCFIIGLKSGTFYSATGSLYSRGNIFEIDNSGLIFIKVLKDLEKTYDTIGNETLNLEYKCLQKILIDLNTKIVELENRVKELENP